MFLPQPRDVDAVRGGMAQQAEFERIARTGRQVGIVGQHDGRERARQIGRVERAHVHAALGQRAGLVGRNDGDRSERLHGGESPNDRAVPGHALDAERQRHRKHRRQSFGHGRHGQRHREDDHLRRAADPFGDDADHAECRGEHQDPARDLAAQLIDATFERRLRGLDVAEHGRQPAHGTGSTSPRHLEIGLAADEQGAAERLVAVVLVDGDGFAGEDGLIQHGAASVHRACRLPGRGRRLRGVPSRRERAACVGRRTSWPSRRHPGLGASQRLQPSQGRFGPLFLIEAERRVEQQDQADGRRFDGPGVRAFVEPEAEIEGEREQQDVDQRTLELTHEPAPERIGSVLGQGVRPDARESFGGFSGGKSVHA